MRIVLGVIGTGFAAVRAYKLRSAACVLTIVVVLAPYLAGESISAGLEVERDSSRVCRADLYVSGDRFGHRAPVPIEVVDAIRKQPGVKAVEPRIVGAVQLGKEQTQTALVGIVPHRLAEWGDAIEGELPRSTNVHELVIGSQLARRLGLQIGSILPPFYRNDHRGERLSKVVGFFKPDGPLWQANLILATYETAAYIFDQEGFATDLLIMCDPGAAAQVGQSLQSNSLRLHIVERDETWPATTLSQRARGLLSLLFLPVFSSSILVVIVASGAGLPDRRREVAILKATGWQTDELLLRATAESVVLSAAAAVAAFAATWIWLSLFNGYGAAHLLLTEDQFDLPARIPYRFTAGAVVVGLVVSAAILLMGTLFATWRAAEADPSEVLR